MAQTVDMTTRIEGVAQYLGATFAGSIHRYEDTDRDVVGFQFVGSPHGNVEFDRGWLSSLPSDVNGVAQEMHLRHVCSEINETEPGSRVVFTADSVRHERL